MEGKIECIDQLMKSCNKTTIRCLINSNSVSVYGSLRVHKWIKFDKSKKLWGVSDTEDGIFKSFSDKGLKEKTCIVEAMNRGELYLD